MDAQLNNCCPVFRFYVLLSWLCSLTVANGNASEPVQKKEPEVVYVGVEQARLYAGPSSDFYPTGNTPRGTVLDVYHRTPSGWLGVRPPQGSFSWVPASQAYLLPGGRVIEITDANSVSWIGTELGSAKQYRWQVQLKVGEQLTVLDEATVKSDADDREALWYKVSPPAGEFRWIEEAAVSKSAPPVASSAEPSDAQTVSKAEGASTPPPSNPSKSNLTDANKNEAEKAAVQPASFEKPAASARNSKRLASNAKRAGGTPSVLPENTWDGWYAFEMGENGMRTPFLDKLSGRDRGQSSRSPKAASSQRDPLLQDPFSLTMSGGQPQKPLPDDLNAKAIKQREWRDPQSLRDARLAGSPQPALGSIAARRDYDRPTNAPAVHLASSDNSQSVAAAGEVNTAGYDRSVLQAVDSARANVNWFGLSASLSNPPASADVPPNSASGAAIGVVTSTADVGELQLSLNNAVASSIGPWNLAPLAERARYLIEHGPTALDRGQARLLLERIEAFQNVSARTQSVSGIVPLQSHPVQSASFNAAPLNLTLPNSQQGASATYEATGWLVPVHAAGPDQPTHALTNDTGDVVAYVSPIAGLNLDRYRNQAVGINGLRGYLPKLQAAHIQAQRVSRVR